jgi:hypothetical protein
MLMEMIPMSDSHPRLQQLGINREEVVQALALSAEPYTIFLSGSIIEGYGNANSDLDVYVIYPGAIPPLQADFKTGQNLISMEYTTNWRLDVESWAKDQIFAVAQRLHPLSEDWNQYLAMNMNDVDLAHGFQIGIPILHSEHFQELRQAFDFEHVSRMIMQRALLLYFGVQEDAAGALDAKQYGAALLMARRAVQLAIDIWVAFHGETNTRDKWRFFKLEKLGDQNLVERYWELETCQINGRDGALEYAKKCLSFASQLVLKVQKAAR